jgi:hypothetical protein
MIPGSQNDTAMEGTGAISGVVVDATTGQPVAGAVVSIQRGGPAILGVRQITDGAGRFVFTRLPASPNFTLGVSKFGYLDGGYGRSTPRAATRRIELTDGLWLADVTVKLWRPGAISGTVRDEAGEPVVGVFVRALTYIPIAGEPRWVSGPLVRTDDRGIYRITNLQPGRFAIMVPSVQTAVPAGTSLMDLSGVTATTVAYLEAAGRPVPVRNDPALNLDPAHNLLIGAYATPPPTAAGRPQAYPILFHPSARAIADAAVIDLASAEERQNVDVQLRPQPTSRVSGRVEGPLETIAGLTLRLMPSGSESMGAGHEAATALVGDQGRFTFLAVPDGRYTILAGRSIAGLTFSAFGALLSSTQPTPPGPGSAGGGASGFNVFSAPNGTSLEIVNRSGDTSSFGRAPVDVAGADVSDVLVKMQRGVTISGRLVVEAADPNKPPTLLFALMTAEAATGDVTHSQSRAVVDLKDPTLPFRVEGLGPGEFLLRATIGSLIIKSISLGERNYTTTPFDTTSGHDISGVIVTLTPQVCRINGTVRDAQGRAVANAAILVFPTDRQQWNRMGIQPTRFRSIPAASNGSFTGGALPAGEYFVVAVDDALAESWKDPKFLASAAGTATRVTLGWGDTRVQDLTLAVIK